MANIETLLKRISEIVVKEKIQQEEKRKRGENFNIFSVLGLSTSEVRLHSAFLAELLNPDGDHGLSVKFLDSFLSIIIQRVKPGFEFDIKSAKVRKEYSIGSISEDYTEGGQIDLLIIDDKNHAIVIENKIYAIDQKNQLLRYQNYAKKSFKEYVLLYLTLDKKEADESSTDNKVDYQCISYNDEILPWLNQCISLAALFPKVRETIAQYKLNLESILNIMSENDEKRIIEFLISEPNIESTLKIYHLSSNIGRTIRKNFINQTLRQIAKDHDMDFDYDEDFIALGTHSLNYKDICFKLRGNKNCYFQIQNEGNRVYYGIVANGYPESLRYEMEQFEDWTDGKSKNWPYGSKYFPGNLRYWDWHDALLDMVKGNEIKKIIDKELTRIIEHRLIEKYSELMDNRLAIDTQAEV